MDFLFAGVSSLIRCVNLLSRWVFFDTPIHVLCSISFSMRRLFDICLNFNFIENSFGRFECFRVMVVGF